MISPIRSPTRPRRRARSPLRIARAARLRASLETAIGRRLGRGRLALRGRDRGEPGIVLRLDRSSPSSPANAAATTSRAPASWVAIDASISPSSVCTIAPPRSTRRSACTSRCSIPPSSALQRGDRVSQQSPVSGVDEDRHPMAVGEPPEGAAGDVDHPLGLDLERGGDELLGERERRRRRPAGECLGQFVSCCFQRLRSPRPATLVPAQAPPRACGQALGVDPRPRPLRGPGPGPSPPRPRRRPGCPRLARSGRCFPAGRSYNE